MPRRDGSVTARARRIRMVLLDVDGVLTDGGLYYTAGGHELKRFHAHDGYGIQRGREAGLSFGIISGRSTPIVEARARVLKFDDVMLGAEDKVGLGGNPVSTQRWNQFLILRDKYGVSVDY